MRGCLGLQVLPGTDCRFVVLALRWWLHHRVKLLNVTALEVMGVLCGV